MRAMGRLRWVDYSDSRIGRRSASPDGDNQSGGVAWGGDGEGSSDGYVAGDEASSPAQRLQLSELSVGGEARESDLEAV